MFEFQSKYGNLFFTTYIIYSRIHELTIKLLDFIFYKHIFIYFFLSLNFECMKVSCVCCSFYLYLFRFSFRGSKILITTRFYYFPLLYQFCLIFQCIYYAYMYIGFTLNTITTIIIPTALSSVLNSLL